MALKTYKPTTPGQRQLVLVDRSALYKGKPVKGLTVGLTKSGGRNNSGRITTRHIGGGHKRTYRLIDFRPLAVPEAPAIRPANCSRDRPGAASPGARPAPGQIRVTRV